MNLDNTVIIEHYKTHSLILSIVNFLTPLACCGILLIPFVLAIFQFLDVIVASWISVILALSLIFVAGTYLGRGGKMNPHLKGLRMVFFGVVAFAIGYFIQMLI